MSFSSSALTMGQAAEGGSLREEIAALRASLAKIGERLGELELVDSAAGATKQVRNPHPSLDKFAVAEAIADLVMQQKGSEEKACQFEPNDRPCDHCSMCSSRGF